MRLHVNFSVMTPLFAPIILDLQKRHGVTAVSGFVYGREGLAEISNFGVDTAHVRVLSKFLDTFDQHADPDMNFLREKEEQYGAPNLYAMIAGCRFVSEFDYKRARRVLEGGFRLIEGLFDEFKPDAVLSDGVACTMSYIQYAVARRRGIPFLTLSSSRLTNRFYVTRTHLERYERVEALYAEYKTSGMPAASRARAEAYLANFRRLKEKPAYFLQWAKPPAMDMKSIRELARLTYLYYVLERGNYILMSPFAAIGGRIKRLLKTFVFDKKHFQQPIAGEKFVFFPLHYQPEQTTLIWAPYHIDQIASVENIAKTLPIDHRLYVKEHKGSLGRRAIDYYTRLKKIPNVRLIDPYVDSHDLIQNASAVCVLTSTVAWEAMLYEKPVVSLGEAFFNAFDLVIRVRAMDDLPAAFRRALHDFIPDRELLLAFIAAHLDGTYEGNADYMPGISARAIDADRIRRLSDVVAGELGIGPLQPAHVAGAVA
jgi:hypothetical protein